MLVPHLNRHVAGIPLRQPIPSDLCRTHGSLDFGGVQAVELKARLIRDEARSLPHVEVETGHPHFSLNGCLQTQREAVCSSFHKRSSDLRDASRVASLQEERKHLAQADQDITDGERRVTEQILRIEEMEGRGEDTQRAREMLQTLEATLAEWYRHRQLILDEIAHLTVP
jgi:hypothetical protein